MNVFGAVLIAFLFSLFFGSIEVRIGLGIATGILAIIMMADNMKWFD
jgi:hypothetical protein